MQARSSTQGRLEEGDAAPDFTLKANAGAMHRLAGLKGKKVVLYFYPKDDTPGCTLEAKDFARLHDEFVKANAVVLGVSKDTVKSHEKFVEKYCLPFPLLSDEDGAVCEAYGVWAEKSMYGKKYMGIERTTFLIDTNGRIARIWNKVKVDGHAEELLAVAKSF